MLLVEFALLYLIFTDSAIILVQCRGSRNDDTNANSNTIKDAECQCVGQRYFCPASTVQKDQPCIDYSVDDPNSGLPACQYVWQYKRHVINFGVELSSCFETTSCLDRNESSVCICKDRANPHEVTSVTARAMTTCHFFHEDQPFQFLDCICKAFHSEKTEAKQNVENTQKIVLVLLVLLFISMMSLACIISCYTYSTRPPRIPFGDDD